MAEEKITPELANDIACNAMCFQKNPSNKWFDIKKVDPNSKQYHENAWEYDSPVVFILYESGRIVYENQIYTMNEKTRSMLQKTLKDKEKAAKRKKIDETIRYTIAISASVIAIVVIVHSINNIVNSKQDKKEKVQTVKDSVLNSTDTVSILQKDMQR